MSFVSFFIFWFLHKWKAGFNTKGFDKKKWLRRIKNGWFQNNEVEPSNDKKDLSN